MGVNDDYIAEVASVSGRAGSYWLASSELPEFGAQSSDIEADVAVIGAGMAGVLTAAFLADKGMRVALLEARRVLGDVTGHTTAKLNAQHGEIFARLGKERGAAYAAAQLWAIEEVFRLAETRGIECDLAREDFYLYTRDETRVADLRREAEAAAEAGMPAEFAAHVPAPFPTAGGVRVRNQARFHPLKFLVPFLDQLAAMGAGIHEGTRALQVKDGEPCVVTTDRGEVRARDVVVATNFPMHDTAGFFSRLYPHRSYALAIRREEPGEGMFYTDDPEEFGLRYQPDAGGTLTIVSGAPHKAGQGGDEREHYAELERTARERLGDGEVLWHWSTQDNHTPDKVPFIGREPLDKHVYMATGFGGWGMTNSVVAARVITGLITGETAEWADLFDPGRVDVVSSAGTFLKENVNVAKQLVGGIVHKEGACDPDGLRPGEGGVCVRDGEKTAVFRDQAGELHWMDAHCMHLGCVIEWNEAEKTFDCPCHGSRYDARGRMLHGPTVKDLKPAEQG